MPLYQIHHSAPLTTTQQQSLAHAITTLHCTTFSAPSIFVNITFHPTATTSPQTYVGARLHRTNYILGHLRPRPNNAEKLKRVVERVTQIWDEAVGKGEGRLDDATALHNVFLMEDIVAGAEQGFVLPAAGRDGEWVRENMREFKRRAGDGDESMEVLVGEYRAKL